MNVYTTVPTERLGLIVAIMLTNSNPGMPGEEEDIPYSSQKTEESSGLSPDEHEVENLPPEQPDVDPLEAPVPDIDEIEPDTDREIDTDYLDDQQENDDEQDNIDRDPTIAPGTDPMKTDNSQII